MTSELERLTELRQAADDFARRLASGTSDALAAEWAQRYGLKRSYAHSDPIPWLLGQRTTTYQRQPRWFDHGTRWTRNGRPCALVGQPYGLTDEDVQELDRLRLDHALQIAVDVRPCWHYPGGTLGVVVSRGPLRGVSAESVTMEQVDQSPAPSHGHALTRLAAAQTAICVRPATGDGA